MMRPAPATPKAEPVPEDDIRPLVGRPVNDRSVWIFGGAMLLVAILLFSALEARRSASQSPDILAPRDAPGNMISAPPPLTQPPTTGAMGPLDPFSASARPTVPNFIPQTLPGVPNTPRVMQPGFVPGPPVPRQPAFYDANSPDPPYVPVTSTAVAQDDPEPSAATNPAAALILAGKRVGATRFANPGATVPQGAVIQAVLETALDSNRPGFVRAIVSRDVRSFDGSKVLIPRGSRLFGEYKAELARGQNRAFIQWLTLTRPDGVQIAVNSPAADQLGRSGVKGDVNSHFFERFAGALLQSTLDLGVGLLTRSATNDTVVIGLPGSTSTINTGNTNQVQPTLKVKHGASVSVFVARDLDFTAVL